MLHANTDLLNVARLEEVLVGFRVKALVTEADRNHIRDLPSFIISVPDNSLKHALAPLDFAMFHGVAAELDKVVINDLSATLSFLDVLNKVDLENVDDQVFLFVSIKRSVSV